MFANGGSFDAIFCDACGIVHSNEMGLADEGNEMRGAAFATAASNRVAAAFNVAPDTIQKVLTPLAPNLEAELRTGEAVRHQLQCKNDVPVCPGHSTADISESDAC